MNYYNEIDRKAAQWLRNLISAGLIPAGDVDERSITEVKPDDLRGYTQCHFFAGIGGWSYALQLAGWSADRPVWTGSCPCQPYSSAGKQLGNADDRNLWPAFFTLIRECRPVRVFGEQVATAIGHGWLDGISADLETEGYACGAVVLGAHSVGAPHLRQRLYWMADSQRTGLERHAGNVDDRNESGRIDAHAAGSVAESGGDCGLSDADQGKRGRVANSEGCNDNWPQAGRKQGHGVVEHGCSSDCGLSNSTSERHEWREDSAREARRFMPESACGSWGDHWIPCADGKARRIEPGLSPLAHGVPARVVRLRGYGNAIVPQVAAEFIKASDF